LPEYRITPLFKTAEQIEKQLKEAQEFLKKYPLPPRRDPKDVIQAASTQRLLDMTDEELALYRERKNDLDKIYPQGRPDLFGKSGRELDEYLREFTGTREVSADEVALEEDIRRKRGNLLNEGASTLSSASDERKEHARQAFTCTPPASLSEKEIEKLTTLNKITEYRGPVPEELKPSFLERFSRWFKSYAPTTERKSYAEIQEILRKEEK
jgi:hypothetical protein